MPSRETRRASYEYGKKRGLTGEGGILVSEFVPIITGLIDIGAFDRGYQDGRKLKETSDKEVERRLADSSGGSGDDGDNVLLLVPAVAVLLLLVFVYGLFWLVWAGGFGLVYSVVESVIRGRPTVTPLHVLEVAQRNSVWLLLFSMPVFLVSMFLLDYEVGPGWVWIFLVLVAAGGALGCAITAWHSIDSWSEEILLQNTGLQVLWTILSIGMFWGVWLWAATSLLEREVKMPRFWTLFLWMLVPFGMPIWFWKVATGISAFTERKYPAVLILVLLVSYFPPVWRLVGTELRRRRFSLAQAYVMGQDGVASSGEKQPIAEQRPLDDSQLGSCAYCGSRLVPQARFCSNCGIATSTAIE